MWADAARLVQLGGPVVAVLLAISVFGLALAAYKWLQLATVGRRRFEVLHRAVELWHRGDREQGAALLDGSPLDLARDLRFGLEARETAEAALVRDELYRRAAAFLRPYAAHLRTLELIYYTAPVLGLLGTVLGMIEAFRSLESGATGGGPSGLAGGIWEALLTTAVGLCVAIPFAAVHAFLETRVSRLAGDVEDAITRVLTGGLARGPHGDG